jgi:dienelactone hydrolase
MKPPETEHSTKSKSALIMVLAALVILSMTLLACGGSAAPSTGSTPTTPGATTGTAVNGVVQFTTTDGVTLSGRLYGAGASGVILCHMYPADQTSWDRQAGKLADQGYLVLTFDFRGYGKSQGTKDIQYLDKDVLAAFTYLGGCGAQEIALVGASMGGTACLKAATQLQEFSSVRLACVATFSAPVEFKGISAQAAMPAIVVPMMFVAAEGDVGAAGAQELQRLSGDKGVLHILPGSDHGTDLFTGSEADSAWQLLLDFLRQNLSGAL